MSEEGTTTTTTIEGSDGGDLDGRPELEAHGALVAEEPPVDRRRLALKVVALAIREERHQVASGAVMLKDPPTSPMSASAASGAMLKNCTSICTPVDLGSSPFATAVMMPCAACT